MNLNKSHKTRKLFVLLALALACLVVSGCGSSDDGDETGSTVLVKTEYVKRGNEICAKSIKKKEAGLKKVFAQFRANPNTTEKEQEELVKKYALPSLYEMVENLAALGLPEGEEAKAEKMLKNYERAVSKFKANAKLALTQYATYMNKPSEEAKELGLKTCQQI